MCVCNLVSIGPVIPMFSILTKVDGQPDCRRDPSKAYENDVRGLHGEPDPYISS